MGAGNVASGATNFSGKAGGMQGGKAGTFDTGFFGMRKKQGSFTPYTTG